MKSILPIIFVILALTGAISYSLAKRSLPAKPVDNKGIAANQLESGKTVLTPTPTIKVPVTAKDLVLTPTSAPSLILPSVTEKIAQTPAPRSPVPNEANRRSGIGVITKTVICTPVYGSADTCTEHVVVDTGVENALFLNIAGFAYVGGLLSFIKAKSLK